MRIRFRPPSAEVREEPALSFDYPWSEQASDLGVVPAGAARTPSVGAEAGQMRFLGIGDSCDLGSLYRRLIGDGHEVKVHVGSVLCQGTLAGIVPKTDDWADELDWISDAGD